MNKNQRHFPGVKLRVAVEEVSVPNTVIKIDVEQRNVGQVTGTTC